MSEAVTMALDALASVLFALGVPLEDRLHEVGPVLAGAVVWPLNQA